jgi:SNF family Na+-dependent transporter
MVGFPLLYLELSVGQFSRASPAIVYGRVKPVLQGVGWAMVMLSLLVSIYYNLIVAWAIFFIYTVITGNTGMWASCINAYNTICKS